MLILILKRNSGRCIFWGIKEEGSWKTEVRRWKAEKYRSRINFLRFIFDKITSTCIPFPSGMILFPFGMIPFPSTERRILNEARVIRSVMFANMNFKHIKQYLSERMHVLKYQLLFLILLIRILVFLFFNI